MSFFPYFIFRNQMNIWFISFWKYIKRGNNRCHLKIADWKFWGMSNTFLRGKLRIYMGKLKSVNVKVKKKYILKLFKWSSTVFFSIIDFIDFFYRIRAYKYWWLYGREQRMWTVSPIGLYTLPIQVYSPYCLNCMDPNEKATSLYV